MKNNTIYIGQAFDFIENRVALEQALKDKLKLSNYAAKVRAKKVMEIHHDFELNKLLNYDGGLYCDNNGDVNKVTFKPQLLYKRVKDMEKVVKTAVKVTQDAVRLAQNSNSMFNKLERWIEHQKKHPELAESGYYGDRNSAPVVDGQAVDKGLYSGDPISGPRYFKEKKTPQYTHYDHQDWHDFVPPEVSDIIKKVEDEAEDEDEESLNVEGDYYDKSPFYQRFNKDFVEDDVINDFNVPDDDPVEDMFNGVKQAQKRFLDFVSSR